MTETALVHFDKARQELAVATDLREVKAIRDEAETVRIHLKKIGAGLEMQNRGAEMKIRAERRLGELLAETVRHEGGDARTLSHDGTALPEGISRNQSSRWQSIARIREVVFEREIARVKGDGRELTTAGMLRLAKGIHFSSHSTEWLTPQDIIDRVICLFGCIDLDPCSNDSEFPNVPASRHFAREHDGLAHPWHGRVYMNPPYGRAIVDWVCKLRSEYEAGNVTEALALVPARTDTKWFRQFRDYLVCFISGRLHFGGYETGAPFPSAMVYLGTRVDAFAAAFGDIGDIWVRWDS